MKPLLYNVKKAFLAGLGMIDAAKEGVRGQLEHFSRRGETACKRMMEHILSRCEKTPRT